MEGTLKQHTPNKVASTLKLHLNHKMHLPTLICGVLTTDSLLSSRLSFGPQGKMKSTGWRWSVSGKEKKGFVFL